MIKIILRTMALLHALLICAPLAMAQAGSDAGELWAANDYSQINALPIPSADAKAYPAGLITVPKSTRYLIWVELAHGRLNVLERLSENNYKTLKMVPISIGKRGYGKTLEGDKRTPVGIYRVTSYIPDEDLTEFYGLGAYPINYPNVWDKLQSRTGSGIWLHGLPKGVDQRPLQDSDGCVVVDNESLTYLDQLISPGNTLVVLANDLEWVAGPSPEKEVEGFLDVVDSWQVAWESLNSDRYLSNYHTDFSDFRRDIDAWSTYKARINGAKTFIDVEISDLTAVEYPGEDNLVSMRFYQKYTSSNYNWAGWKELLWRKDAAGRWKIVFEGNG
jgi:murein L,D-transpeptidase YafK